MDIEIQMLIPITISQIEPVTHITNDSHHVLVRSQVLIQWFSG